VLAITVMEYVTHGGDLTAALDVPAPFSEEELTLALERAGRRCYRRTGVKGSRSGPRFRCPMTLPSFNLLSRTSTPTARTDVQLDSADLTGQDEDGSGVLCALGADKCFVWRPGSG
jgi:hypothetical protein